MMFSFNEQENELVLRFNGDLDMFSVGDIQHDICAAIANSSTASLVIDMDRVGYLDSCGIGFLVKSQKLMRQRGGSVSISNVRGDVSRMFKLSGLDRFFSIA